MRLYFYDKNEGHKREQTDMMIRESLNEYISGHSLTPYDGKIKRTALGKPYIDYPLFIGVTHTDNVVIIGIDEENFGIDAEKEGRKTARREKIADKFFAEKELDMAASDESFLDLWVKKEAYVKFTGEGISAMKNCDTTQLSSFEKIENDRNLIIYIYKE